MMGTKDASKKWGYSQSTISEWCRNKLIDGVEQDKPGSPWRIPENAECPRPVREKAKAQNEDFERENRFSS